MVSTTVQANPRPKYERTTDPRRMLTHAVLSEVIRTDWENVKGVLPARTATSIRYDKGATKAVAWDEGGRETKIHLPLQDGWHISDGNPFAIPNGQRSNAQNPDALYLYRSQDRSFSGPVGRGGFVGDYRGRVVDAVDGWSDVSGVALIGRESRVSSPGSPKGSNLHINADYSSGKLVFTGSSDDIGLANCLLTNILINNRLGLTEFNALVSGADANLVELAKTLPQEKLTALRQLLELVDIRIK
ncbi:MAG: hypothetical protein Q7S22_03870 [Candidatus Micrarchaeota archaeon]|nr:hypothetical protein [Candidatus Micrarchaeota archaeon]